MQVNSTGTGESTDRLTSLHHAVDEGNLALVHQLLTKFTTDPNVSDEVGRTPLWWAASDGDQLLVRSLLDDPRTERHRKDNSGRAPVDAVKSGNKDEIVCLLTYCYHRCPGDIFAELVLIVILVPTLLLLSLASVVDGRLLSCTVSANLARLFPATLVLRRLWRIHVQKTEIVNTKTAS